MTKWLEMMSGKPDFYAETGVPATQIEQAETTLNLSFSPDYRECLREFGAISVGSHELTGFSSDNNLNVVEVTQRNRKRHDVGKNLYVIEETHIDGIVVWQDADGSVYETTPGTRPEKIAGSLSEYIGL